MKGVAGENKNNQLSRTLISILLLGLKTWSRLSLHHDKAKVVWIALSGLYRRQISVFICVSCVAFLLKHLAWLPVVHWIESKPLSLEFTAGHSSIQPGFLLLHEEWLNILEGIGLECDEFFEGESGTCSTVLGGAKSLIEVIEAGIEVQLPDPSKNVGTWLQEYSRNLDIYARAQRPRATRGEAWNAILGATAQVPLNRRQEQF